MPEQDDRVASLFIVPLMQGLVGLVLFIALLNRQRDLAVPPGGALEHAILV